MIIPKLTAADWFLIISVIAIIAVGFATITYPSLTDPSFRLFEKTHFKAFDKFE